MPTFVIHSMGQDAQLTTVRESPVSVGRDKGCHIVLPGEAVSRQHATFVHDAGKWHVGCVSETNPIVVRGALVTCSVPIEEGAEVLIGSEHLLVFSVSETTARRYLGQGGYHQCSCKTCGWKGLVGIHIASPSCPKCGSSSLESKIAYEKARAVAKAQGDAATAKVGDEEVKKQFAKLRKAKRSYLERIDGDGGAGQTRADLSEKKTVVLGKGSEATMPLRGITLGEGVRVAWDGKDYVAQSGMTFPAMKINGVAGDVVKLKSGDVIEIGGNRFRFSTE